MHACDPSTWQVEASGSEVQGCLWLHSEFKNQTGVPQTVLHTKLFNGRMVIAHICEV